MFPQVAPAIFSLGAIARCTAVLMLTSGVALAQAQPDASAPTSATVGEVTGNDVYVRSGPSTNHYPVAKLNAGDRVTIVSETGEWYEIVPPDSAFSWISAEYVDTPDRIHGVVNGDNVLVRAGSDVPAFERHRSTVQMKLAKGTEITILGESADGYLRIRPPQGVSAWIASSLVTPVGAGGVPVQRPTMTAGVESPNQAGPKSAETSSAATPAKAGQEQPAPSGRVIYGTNTALAGLPATPQRWTLTEVEEDIVRQMEKPAEVRDFSAIVTKLRSVANQDEDKLAKSYAEARLQQFSDLKALDETVARLRQLNEQSEAARSQFIQKRGALAELALPTPAALDARGVLRESAVFTGGGTPRRFRLMDTSASRPKTVAYVEIPPDLKIDMDRFMNRKVGVRASSQRLQLGTVDAVPVYIVREMVLLEEEPVAGQG